MKYYIAADGGGTKLQAVLYDEDLRVVNSARMFGTNTRKKPEERVEEEIERMLDILLPVSVTRLEGADLCILRYSGLFCRLLERRCLVAHFAYWDEGETALAAAGERYGVTAQAGTGSDAFLVQPDRRDSVGGWGYVLGDEGSGYDIGLRTLRAAIYASDGRGPQTSLLALLTKEWGLAAPRSLVGKVMEADDSRDVVASAARIAACAAHAGDGVALSIYEEAGRVLAWQVLTLLARCGGGWQGPVVASGGAWKGHPRMFEAFCARIRENYPQAEICYPLYEPVAGLAVLRRPAQGESFGAFATAMQEGFGDFLYGKQ